MLFSGLLMKTTVAILPFSLLLAGAALAADRHAAPALPPAPMLPASPPPPLWSGFYVGLNAGGAWSDNTTVALGSGPLWVASDNPGPSPPAPPHYAAAAVQGATGALLTGGSAGFIGGGQIGYNYQPGFAGDSLLVGLEADIQGVAGLAGAGNSLTNVPVYGPNVFNDAISGVFAARKSLDYLGTVRGRLGYIVAPTLLVYGTGGLAYGGVNLGVAGVQSLNPPYAGFVLSGPGAANFSDTRAGWTAGGGVEWMFMRGWSAKVEYLYYDLGSIRANLGGTTSTLTGAGAADGLKWATATQAVARFNGNIVRAGVNYHFNWGGEPVVASY